MIQLILKSKIFLTFWARLFLLVEQFIYLLQFAVFGLEFDSKNDLTISLDLTRLSEVRKADDRSNYW